MTALLVGWIFVVALLLGRWGLAAVVGFLALVPGLALGIAFHSRHLKIAQISVDGSNAA